MDWEQKREALKRWYIDHDKTMLDFTRDVNLCRNMNSFPDVQRAIEYLFDEHVALGNISDEHGP